MDPNNDGPALPTPPPPPNINPPTEDAATPAQPAHDSASNSFAPAPNNYTTYQLPTVAAPTVTPEPSAASLPPEPLPTPQTTSVETDPLSPPTQLNNPQPAEASPAPLAAPAPTEPPLTVYHPTAPLAPVPHLEPGQHYQLRTNRATATPPAWPPQPVSPEPIGGFAGTPPVTVAAPSHRLLPQLLASLKHQVTQKFPQAQRSQWRGKLKPIISSVGIGLIIYAIFNSQMLLGQLQFLISPGAQAEAPAVVDPTQAVTADPRIIIPKINVNVPVVYKEKSYDEGRIQKALENGVVHYGTTAVPGQLGNNVIVGHSSNSWWNSGKYKFAFVLLSKLEAGDTFYLHYNSRRYTYEVFDKKIVAPTDLTAINQDVNQPITTLITCDPPGTSWKRLIVQARQISPDPKQSSVPKTSATPTAAPLPGDDSSFWGWLLNLF
ncbi:sortase [Candidatus Microgenomates bacterium]|nr:sortase [Candidatus Microgenomates bacterium]